MLNPESGLILYANDSDATSQYPSISIFANISKMTLKKAFFSIEGKTQEEIRQYFINLVNVSENAMRLGHDYYNLPTYREMSKIVAKRLEQNHTDVS